MTLFRILVLLSHAVNTSIIEEFSWMYMCPLFSRRSILAVLRVVNKPLDSVEFLSVIPIFSDQK